MYKPMKITNAKITVTDTVGIFVNVSNIKERKSVGQSISACNSPMWSQDELAFQYLLGNIGSVMGGSLLFRKTAS